MPRRASSRRRTDAATITNATGGYSLRKPRKKRRGRLPIVQYSSTAQRQYGAWLRGMVRWLSSHVRARVLRAYAQTIAETPDAVLAVARAPLQPGRQATMLRTDAESDIYDELSGISIEWEDAYPPSAQVAAVGEMVATTDRVAASGLSRQVGGAVKAVNPLARDPQLATVAQRAIADNVQLIRSVQERYLADVGALVSEGLQKGTTGKELAKLISERTGVASRRATLIARDQVEKVQSAITQERQTAAGITSYIWRTSMDDRVRDSHAEREGQVFAWDSPPDDGHAGYPINCRCTSEPILEI